MKKNTNKMSTEFGRLYLSKSDIIPPNSFIVGETDLELETDLDIENKDINVVYLSPDASLADRLIALGIIRRENTNGIDVMLIVDPNTEIKI